MAVNLSPVGGVAAQFFDNDGNVLSGGKIYTYSAGTSTPATTYTSSNGSIAHSNPIVLDSAGRVPTGEIWLTDGINYKFVLNNASGTLIGTYDNISGINSNFISFTNNQEIITATANQTVFNLSITYQVGTNSLSVFVDGVNQYGPGAQYAYLETDSDTVTFVSGLHVGAEVKFTSTQQQGAGAVDASQVSYTPAGTGAVTTNVQAKLRQFVSVADFGALSTNTNAQNKTALQAAITAFASTGAIITVPSGVNYGYKATDKTTWPSFTGVTAPMQVWDYGVGNSYSGFPTAYDGAQLRTFMFTPQTTTVGMHDGNTQWLRGAWAPNYCISNDADLSGTRTADDNRRASYTFFNEGEGTWRIGQGANSSATDTSEELSNFVIEKYAATGDTLGGWNPMLIERKTGNVGFGLTTNAPGASYVFKSVSTGFYQGVFESLGNTSYLILRTSAGSGEDAGVRNVAGDVSFWVPTQGDALTVSKTNRRVSIGQSFVQKRVAQSYSASMALNTALGNWFTITVTNGTAFTMAAPVNVADGQQITITFFNTSGGAMGTITWNSAFKLAAWTNPANGFNRSITFAYDGSQWIETSRTSTDIPN
jgi:hypothetical protein